jgi:Fic family protein
LFKVLDNKKDIHKKSIITEEYKKEFIYQFANTLEKIIVNFNQAIDRQLFYTDFWDLINKEDKEKYKRNINLIRSDFGSYRCWGYALRHCRSLCPSHQD